VLKTRSQVASKANGFLRDRADPAENRFEKEKKIC
jgi:hypothetical protein